MHVSCTRWSVIIPYAALFTGIARWREILDAREKRNLFNKNLIFYHNFIEAQQIHNISLFIHQVVFLHASLDVSLAPNLFKAPGFFHLRGILTQFQVVFFEVFSPRCTRVNWRLSRLKIKKTHPGSISNLEAMWRINLWCWEDACLQKLDVKHVKK